MFQVSVSTITSTVDEIVSRVSESQQDSSRSFFFYSQHTGLPHCGMPEYISSDFTAQAHQQETHPVNCTYCVFLSVCVMSILTYHIPFLAVADHTSKVCFQEAEDESRRVICSVRYRVCPCPSALGGPIPPQMLHCHYGNDSESYDHQSNSSNGSSSSIDYYIKDNKCYYVIAETNGYSID